MHNYEIKPTLKIILKKLAKKDSKKYNITLKKIQEIAGCEDINHYKNLKKPMNEFKRVHIDNSFVLIFEYNIISDTIVFCNLKHHDKIYK